ncbi:MAG: hypothetical protein CVU05_05335 [Bacteroidetes bacterium HGW-Bacteroidetes-21]|jgi:hypothetical protein|nr:MAG: hypothetical protein CVU05_05335 [Bacteroidetes bacterium HGW-Bacteroidetes-21]
MRQLLYIFIILSASLKLAHSQDNKEILPPHSMSFQWNEESFLFYNTPSLKTLDFTFSVPVSVITGAAKKYSFIEKVEFSGSTGKIYFKENPSPSKMRKFLEKSDVTVFFVKGKKVLTETLLDKKELENLTGKFREMETPFQAEWNKPDNLGYYQFRIYHNEAKLQMMRSSNYPSHLYSGKVAEYISNIDAAKKELECFQLNNQ